MLLGRQSPMVAGYAPRLLYPIPRSEGRNRLGLDEPLPFTGVDLWHAYEISWLEIAGKPVVRVGRFTVPATSPNLVESKSFKLYLNSLNNARFASEAAVREILRRDLAAVVGAQVEVELFPPDDPRLACAVPPGICLDALPAAPPAGEPAPEMLALAEGEPVEECLYSHLLRSLCPVTGQPDWATVCFHYRGRPLEHGALLGYIVAYREHREFHEQCVERMFRDILAACGPEFLQIQALYTRRGGLDICPLRSTGPEALSLPRTGRQ
jgi:7-cyano-7-deazaguanine reductase